MPHSGENHGGIQPVRGSNHFRVPDRPARLDDCGSSRANNDFQTVGKGKEGVGGGHAAGERQNGFHRAKFRCIHAAHLAGADAQRLTIFRIDNCVRFDVLADAPGEQQSGQFIFGRRRVW